MKKVIAIGDIHGRNIWKQIVNKETDADKIIFVGDYFDSFNIDGETQINNFLDIMEFKKSMPEKVITLIGNHDYHYTNSCTSTYSGYQFGNHLNIAAVLENNYKQLQVCHQIDKFLFSHAGLTNTWCSHHNIVLDNIEQSVNDLWRYRPASFNFKIGQNMSYTGDDITQGPFWVRPGSLAIDRIKGFTHIVGHTNSVAITLDNPNIVVIDVHEYAPEYLSIIDGIINIETVNENNLHR